MAGNANLSSTASMAMTSSSGSGSGSEASGSVSVVKSSCSWKESTSNDSAACSLQPRTCYECLNEVPSNGNACKLMLTSGMCMNADALDPTTDLTASQLGSTSSSNHVLTNEATYCSPDDETCKACSAQQDIGTGLCRGETNCVCWMICDSPTWEASAQLLLLGAIEAQDEQNESSCALEVTSLSTPTPTIQTKIDTEASDNVCMWKQLGLEGTCGRPRTCMECLNDQLADGTDCTITSAGYCTTMDAYVYEEDYRLNTSASAPHYFPSINTTYCDVLLDGTCSACIKERFNKSATGEIDPSQYCVGTDGCVCVGFCESAAYQQSVIDKFCESSDVASVDVFGVSFRSIGAIVVLCVAVPIVLIVTWSQRLRNAARARAIAFRNRPPANGPILGLAGWKKYREDLIAKEQKALEGVGGNEEVQIADGGRPYPIANPQIASISLEFQDPFEADRLSSASELSSSHEEDEEAATTNTSVRPSDEGADLRSPRAASTPYAAMRDQGTYEG